MESIKTNGLILSARNYGEANRMVSIFTADLGIISAPSFGARGRKKSLGSSTREFSWCELILSESTKDRFRIEDSLVREGFFPLSEDILKLAAAVYFSDLAQNAIGVNNPDKEVLSLLLNTLYAMCYNGVSCETAKMVYELRLASLVGYRPATDACAVCQSPENLEYFDIDCQGVLCANCRRPASFKIAGAPMEALNYILSADSKRIFSFRTDKKTTSILSDLSEKYICRQLEHSFRSLDYYNKLR